MSTTTNYNFKKEKQGHPVRDDDVGDNLDLIDSRIKDREDEISTLDGTVIHSEDSGTDKRIKSIVVTEEGHIKIDY